MWNAPPLLERFVQLIRETTGNVVPVDRHAFLAEVAERRARARGQPDTASYLRLLLVGELEDEWEKLVPLITIKESYFFRAPQQFEALRRDLLPVLLKARAGERRLRVWSAACARGEEPATLAMLLAEHEVLGGWDWSIVASDVDAEALEAAGRGLYGERAVSQVPPYLRERYLTRRGKLFELAPQLRGRIHYRHLNLARIPYDLSEGNFDLIFLRNVLIYFDRALQRRAVIHAARQLSPFGYLFLGASETLWQIHDGLAAIDLGTCFCYRPFRAGETPPAPLPPRPVPGLSRPSPPPRPRPAPTPDRSAAAPPAAEPEVTELPEEPPAEAPCGFQERLLEAARALASNRVEEAATAVEEMLAADPSEPGIYALEGFLADLGARTDDAVASYRAALYLDPALFQVRVLLADCLLRLGSRDLALHQYREVLATLAGGRERELVVFDELPFPNRQRAERRCRQVLGAR